MYILDLLVIIVGCIYLLVGVRTDGWDGPEPIGETGFGIFLLGLSETAKPVLDCADM